VHVDQEVRQSRMFGHIPVRPRRSKPQSAWWALVVHNFLAADDPPPILQIGARHSACEVGPAARFAEELTPTVPGRSASAGEMRASAPRSRGRAGSGLPGSVRRIARRPPHRRGASHRPPLKPSRARGHDRRGRSARRVRPIRSSRAARAIQRDSGSDPQWEPSQSRSSARTVASIGVVIGFHSHS